MPPTSLWDRAALVPVKAGERHVEVTALPAGLPSVEELFMDCLDIEENAKSLILANQLGKVFPLTPEEINELKSSYGRSGYRAGKIWEHYLHKGRQAGVL